MSVNISAETDSSNRHQSSLTESADEDAVPAVHLPFSLSRETLEKRSAEICRTLLAMFDTFDRQLAKFETDQVPILPKVTNFEGYL
jgi:hypothetical protein